MNVINYERCSRTKHWSGLDTDEYETSNVCTLFSAMPWHRDLATKFYRKQVSDPTSVGLTYLWEKADQMNEAYERSLTDNLAKKFKTAESINTFSATPPPPPNPDLRYSGSGLQQGWNSSDKAGGKSGKGSSRLKGGGGSWKGKGRGKGESTTFNSKGNSGSFKGKGSYSRGKGTYASKTVTWNPTQDQGGGKSFGNRQARSSGYGKGASSENRSDRWSKDSKKGSHRNRSPPPVNRLGRCFNERDNGSCNKPNCKWEHSKSRNHTARPSASVSTLNSKSISKVREQWTAKKAAKVAVHLLKTYPDVLAWKSDPRADGASATKSNASGTPNGKVTNANPSVTSHRNSDAMTRQMEKLYSVSHSQGDDPAETRLVHSGNDSMQVSFAASNGGNSNRSAYCPSSRALDSGRRQTDAPYRIGSSRAGEH